MSTAASPSSSGPLAARCATLQRMASPPVAVRRLPPKGDKAVLTQLLTLEKRLFKKADNWGELLVKETQRRNTFLLYAEAAAEEQPAVDRFDAPDSAPAAPRQPPAQPRSKAQQRSSAAPPPAQRPPGSVQHPPAVVGYILYTTTGLNAHISKLAVATEWRRRGVARALVRSAVSAARTERRVASVSLHVDSDNAPALGLYRGEGFESEALLEDYYCRGRHAHKMRLELDC